MIIKSENVPSSYLVKVCFHFYIARSGVEVDPTSLQNANNSMIV